MLRATQRADETEQNVADHPMQNVDEVTSGSFSVVIHVIWVLSILLMNAVATIQRQVAMADGKVSLS